MCTLAVRFEIASCGDFGIVIGDHIAYVRDNYVVYAVLAFASFSGAVH